MNFINIIFTAFSESEIIQELVENRMRAYTEPDTSGPFIIANPLGPPALTKSVSDTYLGEEQHWQIDVQAHNYDDAMTIFKEVRSIMINELNMYPQAGGLDEWFPETERYVLSVNFIGTPKKLNYKKSVI